MSRNSEENEGSNPLVTNEDQVLEFLSEYEGKTWQNHVSSELEWSPAKTSRVLSGMEANGTITRHQFGRKKAVFLPDQEPECVERYTT